MATIAAADTKNLATDRVDIDVKEELMLLQSEEGPLTRLTAEASTRQVGSPEYTWYEDDIRGNQITVNGSQTAGDTTIEVSGDDEELVNPGSNNDSFLLFNASTGEVLEVTSVSTGSNTLTVTRGFGNTSASSISDGEELVVLGNANEENAEEPRVIQTTSTKQSNYTQIFRNPVESSATLEETDVHAAGKGKLSDDLRKEAISHVRDIEMAFKFGTKNEDTSGTHPKRTTRGLWNRVSTNVSDQSSSSLTESEYRTHLKNVFQHGSKEKWQLAGGTIINDLMSFADSAIDFATGDSEFGIDFTRYRTGFGTVRITHDQALDRAGMGGIAFTLDPEALEKVVLGNRDSVLRMNIQAPGQDGFKHEYLSEVGFAVYNEEKMGLIKNVT